MDGWMDRHIDDIIENGCSKYIGNVINWDFGSSRIEKKKHSMKGYPRKFKYQTLPLGSRESFIWIIPKTILCLVLDFEGYYDNHMLDE